MLYDKKWDPKTGTKPSMVGWIEWLRAQDPNVKYSYGPNDCAMARYARSLGKELIDSFSQAAAVGMMPHKFAHLVTDGNSSYIDPVDRPDLTYGGLLGRMEKAGYAG